MDNTKDSRSARDPDCVSDNDRFAYLDLEYQHQNLGNSLTENYERTGI